jgi:hypothetical protein
VHALDGDPEFTRAAQHGTVLSIVNAVVAYNASVAPAARFDGVQLDIEPQALPERSAKACRLRSRSPGKRCGTCGKRSASQRKPWRPTRASSALPFIVTGRSATCRRRRERLHRFVARNSCAARSLIAHSSAMRPASKAQVG